MRALADAGAPSTASSRSSTARTGTAGSAASAPASASAKPCRAAPRPDASPFASRLSAYACGHALRSRGRGGSFGSASRGCPSTLRSCRTVSSLHLRACGFQLCARLTGSRGTLRASTTCSLGKPSCVPLHKQLHDLVSASQSRGRRYHERRAAAQRLLCRRAGLAAGRALGSGGRGGGRRGLGSLLRRVQVRHQVQRSARADLLRRGPLGVEQRCDVCLLPHCSAVTQLCDRASRACNAAVRHAHWSTAELARKDTANKEQATLRCGTHIGAQQQLAQNDTANKEQACTTFQPAHRLHGSQVPEAAQDLQAQNQLRLRWLEFKDRT